LPGEMKQVTVLFCDIVGSTPMTERLGAEAMRDLVSSFLATSLVEVRRYGGTAPQFTGDGFMALFGAPLTHEDHVRRALLAASAIQRVLGGRGNNETEPTRLELPVRVGVHTGPVVFGPVGGDLAMDPTVIGDTANVAARLQQAAEPGTILLSEAIRVSAQDYARVEPIGRLALKGKAEPILAYRLLGVSHRRSGLREAAPARMPMFVDRKNELAILSHILDDVENGHGQVLGVVGEPGIGKSRLLAELRRRLGDRRVTWVEGRCPSYGTAVAYLLPLALLRSHWGIVETDTPDGITAKVRSGLQAVGMDPDEDGPVLLHLLEIKEVNRSPVLSHPEAVKGKAFEIFCKLCLKESAQRPLVLALEDLHWVDKISEEWLAILAENIFDARILLLASYRPDYRPSWMGQSHARQVPLQTLSRDDSVHMVRSVLRAEHLVDLVTQEIVAKADGNPFFLEQLALHVGEARDLRSDLMVPNTIHEVVMARIDRLPADTKQLLQIAAVIGREFPLRLLRAVWKGSGSLESRLLELGRLEFVYERVETEGTVYVFRHALTQETAYGSLLGRQRRAYHREVGHALEELYQGRTDEVAELLALHFSLSDELEKAVDWAISAAGKAKRSWANSEALAYFDDAVRRLDAMPDTQSNRMRRLDAILQQAEVKYALGEYADQIAALAGVRKIVEEIDDPYRRATWHYWTGFLHSVSGGQPDLAIEYCREAARIASESGVDEIDAFAASCLAQVYAIAGRLNDAIEAGERAVASFEARGNPWWAALTLWHLTGAANYLGDWAASLRYSSRGLEHGIALDNARLKAVSLSRMGLAHIHEGDIERGLQCCEEALELSPAARDTAWAKVVRGYGKAKAGLAEGITELSDALAWFESSRMRFTHVIGTVWLAEAHLRQGDRSSARPLIDYVLATSRAAGYVLYEARARWLMSECLAAEEPRAAEDYAETAMRTFAQVGARNDFARATMTRAALRQRAGDSRTARQLVDEAREIFQALRTRDELARADAALAGLETGFLSQG
jgi:class 3 adenylate cyclase/tetratricopeptide (TPR) repeat protein